MGLLNYCLVLSQSTPKHFTSYTLQRGNHLPNKIWTDGMDLYTAIKHAIDGRAVLFLGSGSSAGAKPIGADTFLTGRQLALLLSEHVELTPPL